MIRLGVLLVAIVVPMTTGCDDDDVFEDIDDDDDDDDDQLPPPTPTELVWTAPLQGLDTYNVLSGNAVVRQDTDAGFFTAQIALRNDEPDAVRPWHVHFGTCGSGGGIVGPADAYPPLVIDADGMAATSARVMMTLDPNAEYHVNVHLSQAEIATLIACGDLVLE